MSLPEHVRPSFKTSDKLSTVIQYAVEPPLRHYPATAFRRRRAIQLSLRARLFATYYSPYWRLSRSSFRLQFNVVRGALTFRHHRRGSLRKLQNTLPYVPDPSLTRYDLSEPRILLRYTAREQNPASSQRRALAQCGYSAPLTLSLCKATHSQHLEAYRYIIPVSVARLYIPRNELEPSTTLDNTCKVVIKWNAVGAAGGQRRDGPTKPRGAFFETEAILVRLFRLSGLIYTKYRP